MQGGEIGRSDSARNLSAFAVQPESQFGDTRDEVASGLEVGGVHKSTERLECWRRVTSIWPAAVGYDQSASIRSVLSRGRAHQPFRFRFLLKSRHELKTIARSFWRRFDDTVEGMGKFRLGILVAMVGVMVGSALGGVVPSLGAAARPLAFTTITVPVSEGAQARFGAACFDGQRWWLGGSVFTAGARELDGVSGSVSNVAGVHRPALWWSTDAVEWREAPIEPRTGYGEVSELFTLACNASGLAAVGAATGGAHGNPRTVSWVLDADGVLREAAANFELYNGPRQISVRTITASPAGGWTILGTRVNANGRMGATSWTSPGGRDFVIHDDDGALSAAVNEQTQGHDVAPYGESLVAVGERLLVRDDNFDTNAIVWTSSDGERWNRWAPRGLDLGGRSDQRAQRVASSAGDLLIAGTETGTSVRFVAWTQRVGKQWRRSAVRVLGSSDDVLSNVSAATIWRGRFLIGARVGDAPRVALSSDGRSWTKVLLPADAPTGSRTKISFAEHGGDLIVAVRSENGGAAWLVTEVS